MIKKILDWILGKNSSGTQTQGLADTMQPVAPYKVETPVTPMPEPQPVPEVPAPVAEVTPVTVKAKYKKSQLNDMSKKELLELAATHGLAVKARVTKPDLVKLLSKV